MMSQMCEMCMDIPFHDFISDDVNKQHFGQ